jgi:hypothetical protein
MSATNFFRLRLVGDAFPLSVIRQPFSRSQQVSRSETFGELLNHRFENPSRLVPAIATRFQVLGKACRGPQFPRSCALLAC